MNHKRCKGCVVLKRRTIYDCAMYSLDMVSECPCHVCIVKMVCEEVCDDLRKYLRYTEWVKLE